MRTLVVTKNIPWPPNSGEKQRTLGIVRALAALGPVTVVGYAGDHDRPDLAAEDGVSVTWVPLRAPAPLRWAARILRQGSITAGRWWDPILARAVAHEVGRGVDTVVVVHVQLAGLLPPLPQDVSTVLDMQNVESELTRRIGRTTRSWRRWVYLGEAGALARIERRRVREFDLVTMVSVGDRDQLASFAPHPDVLVVPNAITPQGAPLEPATTPTACYVGLMSWAPNADAAVSFTEQVWPRVRAAVPDARLLLVGRDPTPAVRELAADDVVVTGTVEDTEPWYARSRVALAPLLAGGGSRLKILEALAHGRPVLASSVGAEGLEDLVGRGVLTRDAPDEMAATLIELLLDGAYAAQLGRAGAEAVRADHSWAAATAPLVSRLARRLEGSAP